MRFAIALSLALCITTFAHSEPGTADWPYTEGSAGGGRYSPLAEINRTNVAQLEVAWSYRHGDYKRNLFIWDQGTKGSSGEATPLLVDGRLIFPTPFNRVIALNPTTGEELWSFDPRIELGRRYPNMIISRGVAHWKDPQAKGPCASRILLATLDARLIGIDAATGEVCSDFGRQGTVNLLDGIEPLIDPWEYNVTSPGVVVGDVIVVGSAIADIIRRHQPSGVVRAYDVRTGALVWRFNTIPRDGELGADTWQGESWRIHGGANVWTTMTADLERGWVFLPVSTAGPDFYGGDRIGENLFTDSLVAVDAKTGKRIWHFQTVHHDLWDYDLPAPPNLVQIRRDGRDIDAVALATKMGMVFVLDRETGKPLFPVEERPVPTSDVEGEVTWPTQPFTVKPPPLIPHYFDEDDLWDITPGHLEKCKEWLAELRNEGIYTPPSTTGSILYPFTGGGANWGGASYDPSSRWLYVPVGNWVHTIKLTRLPDSNFEDDDGVVLQLGLDTAIWQLTGKGTGLRYKMDRGLFNIRGKPCLAPPWGWLVAVDLNTGEIRWKEPTGEADGVKGLLPLGPALVTAGGLVFHAGTRDPRLRAHDAKTGKILAMFDVPAGLHGGAITYKLKPDGKQYLVVMPGGHERLGSKQGDYVIAYTLPD